ncbi:hypothetical protein [Lysobacter niastensis]|uniref:Uncharacterized protein n=1 Tax=Lysobacter niastensis TaxID=380629 RepID=A0ABS0BCN3_9GAMM|nr:hypothetical protein [Lysobacter niastensis]MBF6024885.1 hypothetical protein [Lysobacter niastensis]
MLAWQQNDGASERPVRRESRDRGDTRDIIALVPEGAMRRAHWVSSSMRPSAVMAVRLCSSSPTIARIAKRSRNEWRRKRFMALEKYSADPVAFLIWIK